MSLTAAQRSQTARELAANRELSRLSDDDLARLAGWTPERLAVTLAISAADPADVWKLRDLLETYVLEAGGTPVPFSVLTESARGAARVWFGIS